MALTAKERNGVDLEPIPPGVYVATCYGLVDLGTHPNPAFGNESHKVLLQWEVPEVRGEFEREGQKVSLPRAISKRYTLSLSEKANLRRDLESWRGRRFTAQELSGFDLRVLLGMACQLQIVHECNREGRIYASIAAILAVPRGIPRPRLENPLAYFSFEEPDGPSLLPTGLPDWVVKIIMESREWKARLGNPFALAASDPKHMGAAVTEAGVEEDEVPF